MTITIAPADWAAMQEDMEKIYGSAWRMYESAKDMAPDEKMAFMKLMASIRSAGKPGAPPVDTSLLTPVQVDAARKLGEEVAAKGSNTEVPTPMWVPATVSFGDNKGKWENVQVRYKGASSLNPWTRGILYLPFKLKSKDKFFGFKELAVANNYNDPAGMRDILMYGLLRDAGLPSLGTAPYEVSLDHGQGPQRLGLYTATEVVDDTGIKAHFGDDDGNIYKVEGTAASLAEGTRGQIPESFEKRNNKKSPGWADVEALYDALHALTRTSDPAAWRAGLDAVFDTDIFLGWLAIVTFVAHADTYGTAAHNFYVYNNPKSKKLTWVSWDNNSTFFPKDMERSPLDRSKTAATWPLIRFLLDDPAYAERYRTVMAGLAGTVLAKDTLVERIRSVGAVIGPRAEADLGKEGYETAVQDIVGFVEVRAKELEAFLAGASV
ncbi:spore coat protein coth [Hyaloraphidium curvatum]|nr:spore coat protein coth [Hyaloraphidium curvatum]